MRNFALILAVMLALSLGDFALSLEEEMNTHSESNEKSRNIADRFYFPPPGQGIENQDQRQPEEVGLDPAIVSQISQFAQNNILNVSGTVIDRLTINGGHMRD